MNFFEKILQNLQKFVKMPKKAATPGTSKAEPKAERAATFKSFEFTLTSAT
jgi:hypothetical protein